jgi:hypothetical protein
MAALKLISKDSSGHACRLLATVSARLIRSRKCRESTSSGRSRPRSRTSHLGRGRSIAERMGSLQDGEEYDHPAFALVLKLVDKGRAWVKLSGAYRDNQDGPPLMPMSAGSPGRT